MLLPAQRTTKGPTINDQETLLTLFDLEELEAYPDWNQLLSMVNQSFKIHHQVYWNLQESDRFSHKQQFLDELEPEFFTYILTGTNVDKNGASKIYGTVSARMLAAHSAPQPDYAYSEFRRDMGKIPGGTQAWELKVLAVDPSLYRMGIGSMLQDIAEAEIKKRVTLARVQIEKVTTESAGPGDILFTLTTLAEVNEKYYKRRGYRTTQMVPLKLGQLGNIKECHIAHMEKVLEL